MAWCHWTTPHHLELTENNEWSPYLIGKSSRYEKVLSNCWWFSILETMFSNPNILCTYKIMSIQYVIHSSNAVFQNRIASLQRIARPPSNRSEEGQYNEWHIPNAPCMECLSTFGLNFRLDVRKRSISMGQTCIVSYYSFSLDLLGCPLRFKKSGVALCWVNICSGFQHHCIPI